MPKRRVNKILRGSRNFRPYYFGVTEMTGIVGAAELGFPGFMSRIDNELNRLREHLRRKVRRDLERVPLKTLAPTLGVSTGHLSGFKDGNEGLSNERLENIARHYKIRIDISWKTSKTSDLIGHTSATTSPTSPIQQEGENAPDDVNARVQQLQTRVYELEELLGAVRDTCGSIRNKSSQTVEQIDGAIGREPSETSGSGAPRARGIRRKPHQPSSQQA
jgi:hypothetical protein